MLRFFFGWLFAPRTVADVVAGLRRQVEDLDRIAERASHGAALRRHKASVLVEAAAVLDADAGLARNISRRIAEFTRE